MNTCRREFLAVSGAAALMGAFSKEALAQALPPKSPMGIAGAAMGGYNDAVSPEVRADQVAYITYCRSLGAGGVQISPSGDLRRVRAKLEELGMFVEGNARLPATLAEDTAAFEKSLVDAKAVGATVLRSVSRAPQGTSGRRYEGFKSYADFKAWEQQANAIVLKVLPIAEKHGVILALENHKDRNVDEHVAFLSKVSSASLGALVDPGNNMSFIEHPEETVGKLAYVRAVSMKDMGVAPYEDGFLLSEVVFGTGCTDQAALWKTMKTAYPKLNMVQELITRDPLKVPVLTEGYWAPFAPESRAARLAEWMTFVRAKQTKLPYVTGFSDQLLMAVEADNHRRSLEWARLNMV